MWKSYLTAALRNLARNRLHTAITTASLVLGFAAVLTAALVWRYETGFDHFWPNAERTYLVAQWDWSGDKAEGLPQTSDAAQSQVGLLAQQTLGEVEAMTRLSDETLTLRLGQTIAKEQVRWTDANFFQFFPARTVAGDLSTALTQANSIVLTKGVAQKYFGDQPAVGQTLDVIVGLTVLPVRVTAVIDDLPANTHIQATGFVSGATAQSSLNRPLDPAYVYLLAKPGASADALAQGLLSLPPLPLEANARPHLVQYRPIALPHVYLKPRDYGRFNDSQSTEHGMKIGDVTLLPYMAVLSGVILAVAAINFIALMTARGASRAVEVGVRKACGARRRDLVGQFMSEALLLAFLALVLALALVELLSPLIRAFSHRPLAIDYAGDAPLLAACAGGALLIGAVAGFYPALALSSYRPASVLKGGLARTPGSARLRQILVTVQFTPLVFLAIATLVYANATADRGRSAYTMLPGDPLLISEDCTPGLKAAIAAVPGVDSVACTGLKGFSWDTVMGLEIAPSTPARASGRMGEMVPVDLAEVSPETLRFHQLRPLAGRLFTDGGEGPDNLLINATTARKLGYADPADAVGQSVNWRQGRVDESGKESQPQRSGTIIGVMADRWKPGFETQFFTPAAASAGSPGEPPRIIHGIGVRLSSTDRDQTLAAIDRVWAQTGALRPMDRIFYSHQVEGIMGVLKQVLGIMGACIGLGMAVASLGLFGVAAFLAEQRTKEIGVRKALGASRAAMMRMLSFQFVKPVLIANLIVCPFTLILLQRMGEGKDPINRLAAGPDIFGAVLALSLALAFAATFTHAWRATGERPVASLRSE